MVMRQSKSCTSRYLLPLCSLFPRRSFIVPPHETETETETETERERETDRQTDRQRASERDRETERNSWALVFRSLSLGVSSSSKVSPRVRLLMCSKNSFHEAASGRCKFNFFKQTNKPSHKKAIPQLIRYSHDFLNKNMRKPTFNIDALIFEFSIVLWENSGKTCLQFSSSFSHDKFLLFG